MSSELDPCPNSPNCVSTQSDPDDRVHFIEPLPFDSTGDVAAIIEDVLTSSGLRITHSSAQRIDAVATTRILRFKDDVSFLIDVDAGLVHARSASRVGHSDLGANRKRLQSLFAEIAGRL